MRISLKVEFPYNEGSAPPACPQNPYNWETTNNKQEIGEVEQTDKCDGNPCVPTSQCPQAQDLLATRKR